MTIVMRRVHGARPRHLEGYKKLKEAIRPWGLNARARGSPATGLAPPRLRCAGPIPAL